MLRWLMTNRRLPGSASQCVNPSAAAQPNSWHVVAQVGMEATSAQQLLSSLQKAGQHKNACDVLDFIARSGAAPDPAVFRVLVAFCETSGDWPKAMELVQVLTLWQAASWDAICAMLDTASHAVS